MMTVWPCGNSVAHINQVTLRRARLVLRRVTIVRLGINVTRPPRPSQSPTLSRMGNADQWMV